MGSSFLIFFVFLFFGEVGGGGGGKGGWVERVLQKRKCLLLTQDAEFY